MRFYQYINAWNMPKPNGTLDELPNWMLQLIIDDHPDLSYPEESKEACQEQARIIISLRAAGVM